MQLAGAIVVFFISKYLKLLLVVSPLFAIWRYLAASRHAYIVLAELALTLVLVLIMFASLVLAKMDCPRLANYFVLPVLLGAAYTNWSAHRRLFLIGSDNNNNNNNTISDGVDATPEDSSSRSAASLEVSLARRRTTTTAAGDNLALVINSDGTAWLDSIELALGYGFLALIVLHLTGNLCNRRGEQSSGIVRQLPAESCTGRARDVVVDN